MTDADPRIAEWSRADAPEGSPARALHRHCGFTRKDWEREFQGPDMREGYARKAVAAIDAYMPAYIKWSAEQHPKNQTGGL